MVGLSSLLVFAIEVMMDCCDGNHRMAYRGFKLTCLYHPAFPKVRREVAGQNRSSASTEVIQILLLKDIFALVIDRGLRGFPAVWSVNDWRRLVTIAFASSLGAFLAVRLRFVAFHSPYLTSDASEA